MQVTCWPKLELTNKNYHAINKGIKTKDKNKCGKISAMKCLLRIPQQNSLKKGYSYLSFYPSILKNFTKFPFYYIYVVCIKLCSEFCTLLKSRKLFGVDAELDN